MHVRYVFCIFLLLLLFGCRSGENTYFDGEPTLFSSSSSLSSGPNTFESSFAAEKSLQASATGTVRIPILVYHHIRSTRPYPKESWGYKMSVSPDVFATQMRWISEHGYTTIDLDTMVEILQYRSEGPKKPIVITFDDNQLSQYGEGLPVLRQYGQKAVFYLVTNRLKSESFIDGKRAKELSLLGMDIQSHTLDHASLSQLSVPRLDEELAESRRILQEVTGKPVRHIAYPSTMQNKTVRDHAENAGYVTGTIMDPRFATSKDDLFRLPRIQMNDETDLKALLP